MMETVVSGSATTVAGAGPAKHHQHPPPYSPHLKKVLKTYQLSALKSLSGPSTVLASEDVSAKIMENGGGINKSGLLLLPSIKKEVIVSTSTHKNIAESTIKSSSDNDVFLTPAPFPIQQQPILTTSDQSKSDRSETILEGETISCFIVGGERRLCLPQILNTVLSDFSLGEINKQCDRLQIFCSRCNPKQLQVLKVSGVLPMKAPSCGLITQTDAERLCSALLHCNAPKALPHNKSNPGFLSFRVYHECFGECQGIITPALYADKYSRCIECIECNRLFSPQHFVCHAHRDLENQTCHWGFDSTNWRCYLLLSEGQSNSDILINALRDFKERHVKTSSSSKRKQLEMSPLEVKEVSCGKRPRLVNEPPPPDATAAAFNAAAAAYQLYEPAYLYAAAWYHDPWARLPPAAATSSFRPWHAPLFAKDASALRDLPRLLSQGPPVLLHPERVVPLSESERFERQPNVALVPATAQQLLLQKPPPPRPEVKKEVIEEITTPKTSTSPRLPAYNPEIELSSDTEDSSSVTDRNSERGADLEATQLLDRLARCVASCSSNDKDQVRLDGESALRTLGIDLLASREARNLLVAENQLLREKVVDLEDRLKTATSLHSKEMEVINLLRADHQLVSRSRRDSSDCSLQSPASSPTTVITSAVLSPVTIKAEPLSAIE